MSLELDALHALGLTQYGARAYEALVRVGPASALDVAEEANVPPTKVYSVLATLVEKRWVEAAEGRPKLFRARSPSECMARELGQLTALVEAAAPRLESEYARGAERHASPFWILHGELATAEKSLEMARRAKREVSLASAFSLGSDEALARALAAAVRRGARVRVAVPPEAGEAAARFVAQGLETRASPMPVRLLVVDDRQVLVSYLVPGVGDSEDVTSIWHPSAEVARLLASSFPRIWREARPVHL